MTDAARWICVSVALALSISAPVASRVAAQSPPHRVRLAPPIDTKSTPSERWYPRPLSTLIGTVETFDADQLSIHLDEQPLPTRVASERVLEIELVQTPDDQAAAIAAFQQADHGTALPALIRSISEHDASSRPPVWRQQWLSMVASQAAMRSGRGDIAIELVSQLDARPLPALIIGLLPIDWTGEFASNPALVDVAAKRAASDSLAVKLVAASWLLRSPQYRPAAESALKRLAAQSDRPWIAALAGQLVWRTKPPPEIESKLKQWESEIDQLPMALQTGPMVCLLHVVRKSGLTDATKKWELAIELSAPTWHPDAM